MAVMLAAAPLHAQTAPGVPSLSVSAQPPAVVPTLPAVPAPTPLLPVAPVVLPTLTVAQATQVQGWLNQAPIEGLGISASAARADNATLTGDALVVAALDRARAIHAGRIGAGDFLSIWAMRPAAYDPLPSFTAAVAQNRIASWISGLAPPYAGYDGLRRGLAKYQAIRASGGWPMLAAKSAPAAIRARLLVEDPAAASGTLGEALQGAQRRYGLNPTGLLDANTLAALNVPIGDRVAAIMANMERWRWVPRELPTHRVQVNIAAAVLTVFEGDRPVTSMRAVTGRPGNETPMLMSSIHSIVVNPPWNVPSSIATKELWPQGRATLIRKGYKIVGTPETGERIVQPAGDGSALGRLKFDFDNPFAVYLHDTPSRNKFNSYDRLASHGCVRLQKPVELAQLMLESDPKWAGPAVQAAIDTGKTQRVPLPQQVAVYLFYWTAFASTNGVMNFRDDPYGWDGLLASKIAASTQRAQAAIKSTT